MVTVKREVTDESAFLPECRPVDIDQLSTPPLPLPKPLPTRDPQVPWWNPQSKPAPGPQEDYESEFQVGPPTWPPALNERPKQVNHTIPTTLDQNETYPNPAAPAHDPHGYQAQLMLLEQQNKKRLMMARQEQEALSKPNPSAGGHDLQDYQMQLMLLEQQRRQRIMREREEQDALPNPSPAAPVHDPPHGYQAQLMLLEQQNKKRLMMARQEQDALSIPNPSAGGHDLQDYQMQLMLLEQQDKKRRLMMKQAQESAMAGHEQDILPTTESSAGGLGPQDYQAQLMLLEQQNKKRLMMAGREMDDSMLSIHSQTPRPSPQTTLEDRKQSVDSVWSVQFTPESTPGFHEEQGPSPETMHGKPLPFRERPA